MKYKKGILLNNFLLHPQFFQILQIAALWNVCVTETATAWITYGHLVLFLLNP